MSNSSELRPIWRSQNGYTANDRSLIASYDVPGGRVALRKGNVSVILIACLVYWHNHVEPLVWPGIWGYAERLIRGSEDTLSNHASGTAVDANAPQHPLGTAITANFTQAEIRAIRHLVEWCDGVVRWGGDYSGRKDGMHLEINKGQAAVDLLAAEIQAVGGLIPGPDGLVVVPAGYVPPQEDLAWALPRRAPVRLPTLKKSRVATPYAGLAQRCMGIKVDNVFWTTSENATRGHQDGAGLKPVDGIVGMDTWCKSFLGKQGTLKHGSRGPAVELLQVLLGWPLGGRGADGVFLDETAARVKEVQRWGGIDDDAEVGRDTRAVFARG